MGDKKNRQRSYKSRKPPRKKRGTEKEPHPSEVTNNDAAHELEGGKIIEVLEIVEILEIESVECSSSEVHNCDQIDFAASAVTRANEESTDLNDRAVQYLPDCLEVRSTRELHGLDKNESVDSAVTRINKTLTDLNDIAATQMPDCLEGRSIRELHGLDKNEFIDSAVTGNNGKLTDLNDIPVTNILDRIEVRSIRELHDLDENKSVHLAIVETNKPQSLDSPVVQAIPGERVTSDPSPLHLSVEQLDDREFCSLTSNQVDPCDDSESEDFRGITNSNKIEHMGRRISDFSSWWQEFHEKFADHSKRPECRHLSSLTFDKFVDQGLSTFIYIRCKNCDFTAKTSLAGDKPGVMGTNEAAVCGSITSGSGYYGLAEQLAAMGVPPLSHVTYRKKRNRLHVDFWNAADLSMRKAGEEERQLAISRGQIVNDMPYTDVIADGTWSKRSYRGGRYDALGGAAFLIGRLTGKVIYADVRNKYCWIHAEAERIGTEPPPHECFKNWGRDQSSTAMEADIILAGFKCSIEQHGLIYKTLIADEDASTYQAIRDANPYGDYNVTVQKVDCCNHLFRNLCRKISDASEKKFVSALEKGTLSVTTFRALVKGGGVRIRRLVKEVRDIRKRQSGTDDEKILLLQSDILSIVKHVYGDHSSCGSLPIPCTPQEGERNLLPHIQTTGIYDAIMQAVTYFSTHAFSLLAAETSNLVEACNSVFNKFNRGKRVNETARNSYHLRCWATIVQFNSQDALSKIHLAKDVEVPGAIEKLEKSRQNHVANNRMHRHESTGRKYRKRCGTDKYYGPSAMRPDLHSNMYTSLVDIHLEKLSSRQEKRSQIERNTVSQSASDLWNQYRTEMITASRFGQICRMLPATSCANVVKSIRYPKILDTVAVQHGLANEQKAIRALEIKLGKKIMPCGLFIDSDICYLGATPDGLIDDDGIVEIKCPLSAVDMDLEVAVKEMKNLKCIFDRSNPELMNKNHKYFYQVQGQLHITGRKYCIFTLWTNVNVKYVSVVRDDEFWRSKMLDKLVNFYMDCLLPEIIDSRHSRHMPIKEPDSIVQARALTNLKKINRNRNCREENINTTGDNGEVSDSKRPRITEDVTYDASKEMHPTGVWVDIDVDETLKPTECGKQLLEIVRQNITAQEVVADILRPTNLLNDTSIDMFQTIVHENSDFSFHPTSYFGYQYFIQACVETKDMHIIGGNASRHWCCVYYDGSKVMIYDSLCRGGYEHLHAEEKNYLAKRYPDIAIENIFLQPVTAQPDSYSCGVYAAAFATTIALGGDPTAVRYSLNSQQMRQHMVDVVQKRKLMPFPTI